MMMRRPSQTRRFPLLQALLVACAWLPALDAAALDFNGDGARDTVIGVSYEGYYDPGSQGRGALEAGAVDVVYGSISGSPRPRSQHWTLASAGIPGAPEEGDHFGYAVAWGYFNDGPYQDLAIGIPGRNVDGVEDAGAIVIIHGSAQGLVAIGPSLVKPPRFLRQGEDGVPGVPFHGDNFGFSLAAGDLNGQGWSTFWDELVIGEPLRDVGSAHAAGAIHVIHTSSDVGGLDPANVTTWTQGGSLPGTPENGDLFGFALAIGSDNVLAVGAPGENSYAGSVHIIHGGPISPTAQGAQVLSDAPVYRHFGWTLNAAGDRLLVGAPASHDDGGAVRVYERNAAGTFVPQGGWTQDSIFGPGERTEPGDGFGFSLGAGGLPRLSFTW
jgi:hypothetical protein